MLRETASEARRRLHAAPDLSRQRVHFETQGGIIRLSLRFIVPLVAALTAIAYAVTPLVDQLTLRWFVRDLDIRSALVASSVQEPLFASIRDGGRGAARSAQRVLDRITQDERLYALAFCDPRGQLLHKSRFFPDNVSCALSPGEGGGGRVIQLSRGPIHVAVKPVENEGETYGSVVVAHDMSFVQRRSEDTKTYLFYLIAGIAAIVSLITVVIAEFSWRGWVAGLRALIGGRGSIRSPEDVRLRELRPVARDLQRLLAELETERRSRDETQINWSPESLRTILREDLKGEEILIVSNREPYIHVRRDGGVDVQRPASGLVTALEPVMRACSGTWIAHGSGSADRETVDAQDHVSVPPGKPSYRVRRVWLDKAQEDGYYYGFSNSGLWPLCHIAHVRPTFLAADWNAYVEVNRKFAQAVVEEARTADPIVLVQDYHFALLPRFVRERLPEATIISFWHIPWPNPEAFGICPWREEILEGMLGSSILGFHTQFHCNNFLDTVDRYMEARVDRENFTVSYWGETTAVHRYPISIEWPLVAEAMNKPVEKCRAEVRSENGIGVEVMIGVGVDRMDYTKGIIERIMAVERLFETRPEWIGRFSLLQIAAPSRSSIDEYQALDAKVRLLAERINERYRTGAWQPIVLKIEHHDPETIYEYYRAADLCIVSSLHDGMNLVAKEFIACRDDERGVLVLSQFAGASRELAEALIVNPYDIEQCAGALHAALTMPVEEQRDRMRGMRGLIQEFNVYRWAGRMLLDAAQMRMRRRLFARAGRQAWHSGVRS